MRVVEKPDWVSVCSVFRPQRGIRLSRTLVPEPIADSQRPHGEEKVQHNQGSVWILGCNKSLSLKIHNLAEH